MMLMSSLHANAAEEGSGQHDPSSPPPKPSYKLHGRKEAQGASPDDPEQPKSQIASNKLLHVELFSVSATFFFSLPRAIFVVVVH